jgi:uncharacterized membrane protein (DUF4010 family)
MLDVPLALDLIVAALVGLAVGTEREWSGHSTGADARFAGLRTFGLLGVLGGFSGWFFRSGFQSVAVALLALTLLFPVVAYAATMRRPGTTTDGTTEVAAMLVAALGFTAGIGERAMASAVAVVVVVLLAEKSSLQRVLKRADEIELRAAVQFAVLALIVLPILPDRAFGPFNAIRPRDLWMVVLIFSAMNFGGYLARKVIGESRGLVVTGLLGGLVSSTAVALNFSRRSRDESSLSPVLALGVIAACTVLLPRIVFVCAVLRPTIAIAVLPLLAPPFVVGSALVGRELWRLRRPSAATASPAPSTSEPSLDLRTEPTSRASTIPTAIPASTPSPTPPAPVLQNPLGLGSALQMALAFQVVLIVIAFMQQRIGSTGVLVSATILGLTDMDALTVSMTRLGVDPALTLTAAQAIGIGVLSNTALKLVVALVLGANAFRLRVASGLGALAVASGIGLWLSQHFADSIAGWFAWA